jgi:membrane protein YdbS with pleckstrin-like domain
MIAQPPSRGYLRLVGSFRFPPELLGADEDLVLDLRPHWISLARPAVQAVAIVAGTTLAFILTPYRWGAGIFVAIGLAAVAAFMVWPAQGIIRWATSHFVVTTDRVIRRSGLIARKAMEISLERITNVRFRETVLERMIGAGDLDIESAGITGPVTFEDIRKPERVQRTIFERKEAKESKIKSTVSSGAVPYWAAPSVADELIKLNTLREDGVITEDEFRSLKARLVNLGPA